MRACSRDLVLDLVDGGDERAPDISSPLPTGLGAK
jgi:hypothetical protein